MKKYKSYYKYINRLIDNNKVEKYYKDKLNSILYFDNNDDIQYFYPDKIQQEINSLNDDINDIKVEIGQEYEHIIFGHTEFSISFSILLSVSISYVIKLNNQYESGMINILKDNYDAELGRIKYYNEIPNIVFSVIPNVALILNIMNNNNDEIKIKYRVINKLSNFNI